MSDTRTGRDAVSSIYAERFRDADGAMAAWRRDLWQVLVDDFFSRWIPPGATVLDFGCGEGEFINAVEAATRIGADQRKEVGALLDPDVDFRPGMDLALSHLAPDSIDVVFCSNVLEHLASREEVTTLLRAFHRVLRSEGRVLLLGPNLRYTGAAYWDFFDHVLPFTHRSLVEALATAELTPELLYPRFLPYTTVGARRTPLPLVRLYLKLPLAWRFLGAQFFAVAKAIAAPDP